MDDLIQRIQTDKMRVMIYPCPIMADPREEFDNVGSMCIGTSGSRYMAVREYMGHDGSEFHEEIMLGMTDEERNAEFAVILKVFQYEHSGVAYDTSPFNCKYDSGQVGYIALTWEKARKEYAGETDEVIVQKGTERLNSEVTLYSHWANGDVYSYQIEKATKCDCCGHVEWSEFDSCAGFYGPHIVSGLRDAVISVLQCEDKDISAEDMERLSKKVKEELL